MTVTQKTNMVNQFTTLLLGLALIFPLPFLLLEDKLQAFMTMILVFTSLAGFLAVSCCLLERLQLKGSELRLLNAFGCKESVSLQEVSYMSSRVVYVPKRDGFSRRLVGRRVIEFHTKHRDVLRIYVDLYETVYVETVILEVMRVNRDIRWYA